MYTGVCNCEMIDLSHVKLEEDVLSGAESEYIILLRIYTIRTLVPCGSPTMSISL